MAARRAAAVLILATLARRTHSGGGHDDSSGTASSCGSGAIDEMTEACCEPAELCASGVPTECTPACAGVFARFYRECQPLLEQILAQDMADEQEQYSVLNVQCISRLATSAVAVACTDDARGGRRGCGSATIDRVATAGRSGHESHCVWTNMLHRCPATCSPRCSAPSTSLQVGGLERAGFLASMENVSKTDEFCIKNEEFCMKNEELCINNDEFCSSGSTSTRPPELSALSSLTGVKPVHRCSVSFICHTFGHCCVQHFKTHRSVGPAAGREDVRDPLVRLTAYEKDGATVLSTTVESNAPLEMTFA